MTVISTIITRHYTAHGSDSFLTVARADGSLEVVEDQQSKLIRVDAWRGAMGYWGLARHSAGWNTLEWLHDQANRSHKYPSVAEFAAALAQQLTSAFSKLSVAKPPSLGLGIHLTAYEHVQDRWVPELFVVGNWTDATYTVVRPSGFRVTRSTYATLKTQEPNDGDGDPARRLEVHAALQQGTIFIYNNGDPILFNPIAEALRKTFGKLIERGQLKDSSSVETHLSIARRPVEVVSDVISD